MEKSSQIHGAHPSTKHGVDHAVGVNNAKDLPKAVDLSHHLSDLAKAREPSPLKAFFKYLGRPDLTILAGGVPNPEYFPFATLEASTLPIDNFSANPTAASPYDASSSFSWFWNLFSASSSGSGTSKKRTERIVVPKYVPDPLKNDVHLARALQYDGAVGLPTLQAFCKEYSTRFYKPAFSDWTTLMEIGNTDGWSRIAYTFLNQGDSVLVEEWTYPSALSAALPLGAHMVAIPMDSEGMRTDVLEDVLANWNEAERGFRRPHLMYTVPVGQNPSGLITRSTRKKQIYELCVKYDIIIAEDDPYYILQEGNYLRPCDRPSSSATVEEAPEGTDAYIEEFVQTLEPTYLRYDYQGRVIRLDTFSKTIAPGSRLGWFTCNELFAERLLRQAETSSQAPCGFGQAMITQLLAKQWGLHGYVRWLKGLKAQYTMRRDTFIDSMLEELDIDLVHGTGVWEGAMVYQGSVKERSWTGRVLMSEKKRPRISFVPPTSGMFVWIRVNFEGLPPPVKTPKLEEDDEDPNLSTHEGRFWLSMVDHTLLILPGWVFRGESAHPPEDPNLAGHYRVSFSDVNTETMKKFSKLFAQSLKDYFA